MGIRYYKLFDLLNRRGMKKSDLRNILSSATVAKLTKGEYISGEAIEKICKYLNCQPGDIMEVINWEADLDENEKIYEIDYISDTVITEDNKVIDIIESYTDTHKETE